ncbi:DUF1858 domain-containing protein [Patescibacteria group bacterium]
MKKITTKTKISDLIEKNPSIAEVLMNKYGLHCVGCFAAAFETIEQGAKAHSMNKKEIEKMIIDLNSKVKTKK